MSPRSQRNSSKTQQNPRPPEDIMFFSFSSGSVGQHESRKLSPKKVQYRLGTDTNSKTRPPHLQKGCPECKRASGEPSPSFRCQKSASQTLTLSSVRIPLSITGPLSTDQIPRYQESSQLHVSMYYIYICLICIICLRKNMYIYMYV